MMQIINRIVMFGRYVPYFITLLQETGLDLTKGEGIPEIIHFQEHFRGYKIVV